MLGFLRVVTNLKVIRADKGTTPVSREYDFVFVSHAAADKKKLPVLRELVDALIAADIKVWLDKPDKLGFSDDQIEANFINLESGARWEDQIKRGLRDSLCVLGCVSEQFVQRYNDTQYRNGSVIANEITEGWNHDKLVVCRLDECAYNKMDGKLSEQEITDVRAHGDGVARVVKAVDKKIRQVRERIARHTEKQDLFKGSQKLCLVNRTLQQQSAKSALKQVTRKGGVHALMLKAPENEGMDLFRDRLKTHVSPHFADNKAWYECDVDWDPARMSSADKFGELYESLLAEGLGNPAEDPELLLRNFKRPIAVYSSLNWRVASQTRQSMARILDWLRYWKNLEDGLRGIKVVPVLIVRFPKMTPDWETLPKRTQACSGERSKRIAGQVKRVDKMFSKVVAASAKGPGEFVSVEAMKPLHPIKKEDAIAWRTALKLESSSEAYKTVTKTIDKIFQSTGKNVQRVAMDDFTDEMDALVRQGLV